MMNRLEYLALRYSCIRLLRTNTIQNHFRQIYDDELIRVFNWGNSQYFHDAWSYFTFSRNLIAQDGVLCL